MELLKLTVSVVCLQGRMVRTQHVVDEIETFLYDLYLIKFSRQDKI